MCGIIGTIGTAKAVEAILLGLKRLEYRGYDSAGVAYVDDATHKMHSVKENGKIENLQATLADAATNSSTAIGHTRWATHGEPNKKNAHPHVADGVAVVHNGIIENHQLLRTKLQAKGVTFKSTTDTEVIPHLIAEQLAAGKSPEDAVRTTVAQLEGAYALGIVFDDHPNLLIAARHGSPLAVGYGDEGNHFVGSDAFALSPFCNKASYLRNGDIAILKDGAIRIIDMDGAEQTRRIRHVSPDVSETSKDGYDHYMLKEIYEQPQVIAQTLEAFYNPDKGGFTFTDEFPFDITALSHITIVACGTSFYAGQTAAYWFEQYAGVATRVEMASEFRYRKPVLPEGGLAIFISQSGETADTLAALRYCKDIGQHTLALVNVKQSSMAIEAETALFTRAGIEIGVASTKAFTTQLVALSCLALSVAQARKHLPTKTIEALTHALGTLPDLAEQALQLDDVAKIIAQDIYTAKDMMYIGRGTNFPIASEGALKMKEISYIHAEGYAAGELKHGPLALIDESVPVAVLAPSDELFDKTASNLEETAARGGQIILVSDKLGVAALADKCTHSMTVPQADAFITPALYAIPLQLLAYYTAVLKETDVDQPRNLAKSVTVE